MSRSATAQLTITVPDGTLPGSFLSVPLMGREPLQVRVPDGLGPGSTFVLTQCGNNDGWVQDFLPEEVGPPPHRANSSVPAQFGMEHNRNWAQNLAPVSGNRAHMFTEPVAQPQTFTTFNVAEPVATGIRPKANPPILDGVVPGAVIGLDITRDGKPDLIVAGPDFGNTGLPGGITRARDVAGQVEQPDSDSSLIPDGPVAFTVRLDTSAGVIDIIVRPDWAPRGARRFLELAAAGDLDGLKFYRAVRGCLAQFGLPARRQVPPLIDDPPTGVPFLLGAVCFAAVGKNSRKSTLFICTGDMSHCFGRSQWETPIGAVAEASLDALDRIETIYGDIAECGGSGPDTSRMLREVEGQEYLQRNFPLLTVIHSARPLDWPPANEPNSGTPQFSTTPVAGPLMTQRHDQTEPLQQQFQAPVQLEPRQPQQNSEVQEMSNQAFPPIERQATQAAHLVEAAQAVAALFHVQVENGHAHEGQWSQGAARKQQPEHWVIHDGGESIDASRLSFSEVPTTLDLPLESRQRQRQDCTAPIAKPVAQMPDPVASGPTKLQSEPIVVSQPCNRKTAQEVKVEVCSVPKPGPGAVDAHSRDNVPWPPNCPAACSGWCAHPPAPNQAHPPHLQPQFRPQIPLQSGGCFHGMQRSASSSHLAPPIGAPRPHALINGCGRPASLPAPAGAHVPPNGHGQQPGLPAPAGPPSMFHSMPLHHPAHCGMFSLPNPFPPTSGFLPPGPPNSVGHAGGNDLLGSGSCLNHSAQPPPLGFSGLARLSPPSPLTIPGLVPPAPWH